MFILGNDWQGLVKTSKVLKLREDLDTEAGKKALVDAAMKMLDKELEDVQVTQSTEEPNISCLKNHNIIYPTESLSFWPVMKVIDTQGNEWHADVFDDGGYEEPEIRIAVKRAGVDVWGEPKEEGFEEEVYEVVYDLLWQHIQEHHRKEWDQWWKY